MKGRYILGIDQGSTGTKVIVVDQDGIVVISAHRAIRSIYPHAGWLEHDGEELWNSVAKCIVELSEKIDFSEIRAIGVTNQRETVLLWDRNTGEALTPAVSWQCVRSQDITDRWRPLDESVDERTGLNVNPYYSASKLAWLLEQDPELRRRCEKGDVCFGNVNTWLIWKLTGGTVHLTDSTNAGRTMFFNVHTNTWDEYLLEAMSLPPATLPEVKPCDTLFGMAIEPKAAFRSPIPIMASIGDQMSALFGQTCFSRGEAKITLGTCLNLVCFTGAFESGKKGIVPAIAYNYGGELQYEMEGSTHVAGAAIEWLIHQLGIADTPPEVCDLAQQVDSSEGVFFVPAFRGLGTPYWDDEARGLIMGLTRAHDRRHVCRAALDGITLQANDIVMAFRDIGFNITTLKVDGGLARSDFALQNMANITQCRIERPVNIDRTPMGAVYMAGLASGLWKDFEELKNIWGLDKVFEPAVMPERAALLNGWENAVRKARNL